MGRGEVKGNRKQEQLTLKCRRVSPAVLAPLSISGVEGRNSETSLGCAAGKMHFKGRQWSGARSGALTLALSSSTQNVISILFFPGSPPTPPKPGVLLQEMGP